MARAHGTCARRMFPLGARPRSRRIRGGISSHPRVKTLSISIPFPQPGDENGHPRGPYCPASCGTPNPTRWLLIVWGLCSQRASRVASWDNAEVPPHPGRIGSHSQTKTPSIHVQLHQPGDENADPPGRYRPAWCENSKPTGRLLID